MGEEGFSDDSALLYPARRYLSARGQFLEHAPYCERDLRGPTEPLLVEGEDVDVYVRHRQGRPRFTYAMHPFDVIGWDGANYPYAFNIADFEPITGRIHQPPPVHQTFDVPGAAPRALRAGVRLRGPVLRLDVVRPGPGRRASVTVSVGPCLYCSWPTAPAARPSR
jgi:hypothetical protein